MTVFPSPTRWMSPPPIYDSTPAVSASGLTPYLQLSHILSLTWLAYPILSLIFIAFRLDISSDSAQTAISNAKGDLLTGCLAAQQAASSAASMPRFMALATNNQIIDAVNGSMDAARDALILSLTIMEAVINFAVDTYRSTFLCFLELVVRGGLSLIIGATQEVCLTSLLSVIVPLTLLLDKLVSSKYIQHSAHVYSKRRSSGQFRDADRDKGD
jgi:hypothetical protein